MNLYNPNDYLISSQQPKESDILPEFPPHKPSSTCIIVPPQKKARLSSPQESKNRIDQHVVQKNSSEIQVPSDYFASQNSIQDPWAVSHLEFPSISGVEIDPLQLTHEINYHEYSTPTYSVSGTQQLIEFDEPFNLNLEFPIPKYFHAYRSRKWLKKKGTSLNNFSKSTGFKTMANVSKIKSSIITSRTFKAAIYRLGDLPLRIESQYRLPVYLAEESFDSAIELQMIEIDEQLRGHPPTKKLKTELEVNKASMDDIKEAVSIQNFNNEEGFNLKNHTNDSSCDFLFRDDRLNKLTSKVHFLAGSSSETDDEMKNLEDDHPDMADWEYPGFDLKEPNDNNDVQEIKKSVEGLSMVSMEKIKNVLKTGISYPLRLIRSSKVWPESNKDKKARLGNKKQGRKSESHKDIFINKNNFSHNSLKYPKTNNINQNSSEVNTRLENQISDSRNPQSEHFDSKRDFNCSDKYDQDSDNEEEDTEYPAKIVTSSTKSSDLSENEDLENEYSDSVLSLSEELTTHIEKESNESRNSTAVHKTKSPNSLLNGMFGWFRKPKENQDNEVEPSPILIQDNIESHEKEESNKVPEKVEISNLNLPNDTINNDAFPHKVNKTEVLKTENKEKNVKGPKKVSFLQTIWGFFHRKASDKLKTSASYPNQINEPEKTKDDTKRKTFLQKLGFKTRKSDHKTIQEAVECKEPASTAAIVSETDDEEIKLVHKNSISLIRKKRMKLFEETREFYEDSMMAYRNVLVAQAVGSQMPLDPTTISIVNPFSRLASTNLMLQPEQSLGFKCTLSESIILPAMSRRKRRLNQSFFSPEEQIKDLLEESANVDQSNSEKQPRKGILKNVNLIST